MSRRFPAEFEPHEGTVMIWPVRPGSWGKDPSAAQEAFINIFRAILASEDLYVLFNRDASESIIESVRSRAVSPDQAGRFISLRIDSNDSWARDTGPTFIYEDQSDKPVGIDWGFNAWGGDYDGLYADYDKDIDVASSFCSKAGFPSVNKRDLILEGGSIATDGEGTVMVTESCLLSKGRNPSLSKDEITEILCDSLGASKVLWLPRGIYNDETNEHVDNMAAFTAPGEVILAWTDNTDDPQYELSRASYEYLSGITDAKGRKLKIHMLPVPDVPVTVSEKDLDNLVFEEGEDQRKAGERLAASYVNYYYTNGSILLPQFGGDNTVSDRRAVELMRKHAGSRKVIPVYARDILTGGGNIHCITQQIPKIKGGAKHE